MKFYNSFPQTRVRVRARIALLLPTLLFVAGLAVNANAQSSRPVARLIAASDHPTQIASARTRTVRTSNTTASDYAHVSVSSNAAMDERRAFDLINEARRRQGYAPLVWDAELTRMARAHSQEMAQRSFLSHDGPDGAMIARAHELGINGWRALAENIAYNQGYDDPAGFAVERWLKSASHRDNIMRAGFTHAGLGVARTSDGRVYFTQVFVAR